MSADLSVKAGMPVPTEAFLNRIAKVSKDLLGLTFLPTITIQELREGSRYPVTSDSVGYQGQVLVAAIEGADEAVSVSFYTISHHPSIPDSEAGLWAGISVKAMRTALEYALAASIAIALAIETKSDIIDEALLWSNQEVQGPSNFAETLRVRERFSDIRRAAEVMYASLPIHRMKKADLREPPKSGQEA